MDDCGIIPVTSAPGLHFLWERQGLVFTLTSVNNAPPPQPLWRSSLPPGWRGPLATIYVPTGPPTEAA